MEEGQLWNIILAREFPQYKNCRIVFAKNEMRGGVFAIKPDIIVLCKFFHLLTDVEAIKMLLADAIKRLNTQTNQFDTKMGEIQTLHPTKMRTEHEKMAIDALFKQGMDPAQVLELYINSTQ